MSNLVITFDKKLRSNIFGIFGLASKKVNGEKIIVDSKTSEPLIDKSGSYIKTHSFGGITKGSRILHKNDVFTAIKIVENAKCKR